jgi:hypothetical protein
MHPNPPSPPHLAYAPIFPAYVPKLVKLLPQNHIHLPILIGMLILP